MITQRELDNAIRECENAQTSYQNCEKLATFYTILDHLYNDNERKVIESVSDTVGDYGESTFLQTVNGRNSQEMWLVMDELMQTLQIINPRLHDGVMRKLTGE